METIGAVVGQAAIRDTGVALVLGDSIGKAAERRLLHGGATICDIVLASWALGVDSVQAVVDYAEVAVGSPR
ncbi:hypothetical protein [Nocardia bovistercoris]|uniref:Uncharacterized protein n=1 Tax=Nocardia bovistercoris TaxID=2785916 RepID=A0A931N4X7_9NOCA|nr:hypothetical protein [Nocardia bovistercoris]MBH0778746.1 hypothetical protein [Nocardia bovistercoris]